MAQELTVKRFSSRQTMVPFFLDDEETGEEKGYCLVELQGDNRDSYLNNVSRRVTGGGEKGKIRDFKGMQAQLLAMAVHEADLEEGTQVDDDGNKKVIVKELHDLVDIKVIREWPASLQQQLFEETQRISGLGTTDDEDEEETGND